MEDESYTPGSIPIDDIVDAGNAPATGGTQFRYDSTAQQYIFNLKTPKTPGAFYIVALLQDGQFDNGLGYEAIRILLK
jgi:hypothetical protein